MKLESSVCLSVMVEHPVCVVDWPKQFQFVPHGQFQEMEVILTKVQKL